MFGAGLSLSGSWQRGCNLRAPKNHRKRKAAVHSVQRDNYHLLIYSILFNNSQWIDQPAAVSGHRLKPLILNNDVVTIPDPGGSVNDMNVLSSVDWRVFDKDTNLRQMSRW